MTSSVRKNKKPAKYDEILSFGAARDTTRHELKADVRLTRRDGEISEAVMSDISFNGMGLDGLLHFDQHTEVDVLFPNGFRWPGRMVWRDAFNSGLTFEKPLSLFQLEKLRHDLSLEPNFRRG